MSVDLAAEAVEPHLRGRFGRPYRYEPECESSRLLLHAGAPEGAVAVCDSETRTAIDCSVVLRPPPGSAPRELTLLGAIAAAEAVEDATGLTAQIRWPDEVMLNRRKVAGVLAEPGDAVVVLDVGLNVNQLSEQLPADAGRLAGSLRTLVGRTYDRAELLGSLLVRLEETYDVWRHGGIRALHVELGARDFLRGRFVTVGETAGVAEGIDVEGRLLVAGRAFEAGDVSYGA
jgi:BirA family transcriptional regulator, biotin operon repressor / biotin---[acetyl-CoA-carboxylase] ligase